MTLWSRQNILWGRTRNWSLREWVGQGERERNCSSAGRMALGVWGWMSSDGRLALGVWGWMSSDGRLEMGVWDWMVIPRRAYEAPRGHGKSPRAQRYFTERNGISLKKGNLIKTKSRTEPQETTASCWSGEDCGIARHCQMLQSSQEIWRKKRSLRLCLPRGHH